VRISLWLYGSPCAYWFAAAVQPCSPLFSKQFLTAKVERIKEKETHRQIISRREIVPHMVGTESKPSLSVRLSVLLRRRVSTLSLVLGLLLLLSCVLFPQAEAIAASSAACVNNEENEQSQQQCRPYRENKFQKKQERDLVLSINAANSYVNWERINSLAGGQKWEVRELVLDGFGATMRDDSFTAALENCLDTLKEAIEDLKPRILLASSKGFGVIAYLASKNIWVKSPVILFSPIPNPIDGLVDGDSYESEWNGTIDVLRKSRLAPVMVVSGSSSDEEMLIGQAMREPSACGKMSPKARTFEKCKGWRHVVVPGDHGWRTLRKNEGVVVKLIDHVFRWLDKDFHQS